MKTGSILNPWLSYPKPNPRARLRLFCFPYAGGGALIFRAWPESLPETVEVCSVQLPGRGARMTEPLFTHLSPLLQTLVEAILPCMDRPFAFFGHSMGALISFELARYLREQFGLEPACLFVSGRGAPHLPNAGPAIHTLPEAQFLEELRLLNGTPKEVLENVELRKLIVPLLRADFAVCETYQYVDGPPLNCPLFAFGGCQDRGVGRDDLEAWHQQTDRSFRLWMFPGDHFFLHTAQSLVLQALSRQLRQA